MGLIYQGEKGSLRGLASDLSTASGRVGKNASKIIRDAGNAIAREAGQAAPRRTGALSRSMEVRTYGDGRSSVAGVIIAPTVRYSLFVEFGTSKMGPQPYFFPAVDRNVDAVAKALGNSFDDLI